MTKVYMSIISEDEVRERANIVARLMVEQRMADVQDEDDLPIVLEYDENDEEWMTDVYNNAELGDISEIPFDEIWEAYADQLDEAIKEWREERKKWHKIYLTEYGELLVDHNMFENPTAKYLFDMEEGDFFYTTHCEVWDEHWIDFDVNPIDFTKENLLMYFSENFKSDLEWEEEGKITDLEGWDFQLVAHIVNEGFLSEKVTHTIHITKEEFINNEVR